MVPGRAGRVGQARKGVMSNPFEDRNRAKRVAQILRHVPMGHTKEDIVHVANVLESATPAQRRKFAGKCGLKTPPSAQTWADVVRGARERLTHDEISGPVRGSGIPERRAR